MRRARWLVLVVLIAIVSAVGFVYHAKKTAQARNAPKPPAKLPEAISARANDWTWESTRQGRPSVRIWATDMKTNAESTHVELTGVRLHLFHKDGKTYDSVASAKADFDIPNSQMFSDGEVQITMGVPADQPEAPPPGGRLVVVKTSGVHFDSKTGKAFTDRAASFQFDRGEGQSVGAQYDPETRELLMHKEVKLVWKGLDPKKKPMEVESGSLIYKEAEAKVYMTPWSKFRRDTLSMEGANSVAFLKEGRIDTIEAATAKGVDLRPERKVEYSADQLNMYFDEKGELKNLGGAGNAKLQSTTADSRTNVDSGRMDLEFVEGQDQNELRKVVATGGATVRSEPIVKPKVPPADTRIIRSDGLTLTMRAGGKDMERADTHAAGVVEFIPNRSGQKHRIVNGKTMSVEYGASNQIKTFTSTDVSTRTDNDPVKGKPQPPSLTWSKGMVAHFDEKTGNLSLLEQWDHFRYEEGDRRAVADRAEMHQTTDEMKLLGSARVWDATGSTAADTIQMKQKSGDFEAIGNVSSTRQPDQKKPAAAQNPVATAPSIAAAPALIPALFDSAAATPAAPSPGSPTGLLSGDDPMQARAARMTSVQNNTLITYTGNALLWQGSNRITAETIRIDRKNNKLEAKDNVVSQLLDKSETEKTEPAASAEAGGKPKKPKTPVFTNVRAPEMTYDDKTRLAHYKGGSVLVRGGMTVTAAEIRAWLKDGEDSSLDHAFADGNVKIVQVTPERTRTGTADHSEYYAADGRIILKGGVPEFLDSVKGATHGAVITYFSNDDRMVVEGEQKTPARSKILRRKVVQ